MYSKLQECREKIWSHQFASETEVVNSLLNDICFEENSRNRIKNDAIHIAREVRKNPPSGLMSPFLVEYGLTTEEGISLMCLAEALLRVPDVDTVDTLISDKLAPADWGRHLGNSSSSLVNASTWALMLTGKILKSEITDDIAKVMRQVVKRLGEPIVRLAVAKAIKLIADQYILGSDIESAELRGRAFVEQGYRYSYDMLGESALTWSDARHYKDTYVSAIKFLADHCHSDDVRDNPGISVKLSAIHPRYQATHRTLNLGELVDSTLELATLAMQSNMGFNIDAEESDKLDLSLDIIERVLRKPQLENWEGFGVVVQAYGQRALPVIEWLHTLARELDRKLMLRLVKGAYWDTEIKRAQVLGLSTYPVFTRKSSTDLSYLACVQRLFELNDRIYPQFATHNIHTIRSVLELASDSSDFEFQRLHGMGEEVHQFAKTAFGYRCRIYAPVGAHEDLLAYLVRRILENGANSSFVNQLMDRRVPVSQIVSDPIEQTKCLNQQIRNPSIPQPSGIYGESRPNSNGLDLESDPDWLQLKNAMEEYSNREWTAKPTDVVKVSDRQLETRFNPVYPDRPVGRVLHSNPAVIPQVISDAFRASTTWQNKSAEERSTVLFRIAEEYEASQVELIALMVRETGKSIPDAVSEVREAVDFCRYYANEATRLTTQPQNNTPRGVILCISPWNFPLAIFTGQITGALAAGNSVIAKPAEQSPLIASKAIDLMYQAGVPKETCVAVYGTGETVGPQLVSDPRIAGVNFTGSSKVAQIIHRTMAERGNPLGKLVAETGGLNAMIIDSTALPEQAVRDIIVSAFQSAGQRCSALRMLYIQEDMKTRICDMLFGAMETLVISDPWNIETDVGPVIDAEAKQNIDAYIDRMEAKGLLRHQASVPDGLDGYFVPPSVFEVSGIEDLEGEIFGPVLHFASFRAHELPAVIQSINQSGYGLTFGLHSRIDQRVQQMTESVNAGNIYVNRNQIGAIVGCQPFGGRGLSGTGPKAGGPNYVPNLREFRDSSAKVFSHKADQRGDVHKELSQLSRAQKAWAELTDRAAMFNAAVEAHPKLESTLNSMIEFLDSPIDLDAPTGESNRLHFQAKGVFVCIGSSVHVIQALLSGNAVLAVGVNSRLTDALIRAKMPLIASELVPDAASLASCESLAGVTFERLDRNLTVTLRQELARSDGPIVQFITDVWTPWSFIAEKTLCIDTTAAGGNARLLVEAET